VSVDVSVDGDGDGDVAVVGLQAELGQHRDHALEEIDAALMLRRIDDLQQ
jgi:hypothetical protein